VLPHLRLSFSSLIPNLESARHHHLSIKYFRRWKSIYWRRILNRNAQSRREQLAKSVRNASQRKARGDDELEAILEAQKQKERIHAEQLRRSREVSDPKNPVTGTCQGQQKNTQAGHKRKSLHDSEVGPATNTNAPRKSAKCPGHRRSQTMSGVGTMPQASSNTQPTVSPSSIRLSSSAFSGRSNFPDRNSKANLQRSTSGHKTDLTHTDYFRLKALGIDPETPIFPDTKSSLERKRRRQEELSSPPPRKRASTFSSVKVNKLGQDEITSAETSIPSFHNPQPQVAQKPDTKNDDDDDDDFLRQIREVRAALSEDTEWFRTQAAQIEKEVEQEELRRSASQRSSTNSTGLAPLRMNNGLSRVNGYEYSPSMARSGSQLSLSRTEQRIRATGAHGLATKPVSDYLPVAMSKSTRAAMMNDKMAGRPNKRRAKTRHGVKDSTYIYESDGYDEYDEYAGDEVAEMEEGGVVRKRGKQEHHNHSTASSSYPPEAQEEQSEVNGDNEHGATAPHHAAARQSEQLGADEDLYDEDEEEEEEEEDEEDEEAIEEQAEEVYQSNEGLAEQSEGEDRAEHDEADDEADDSALYEEQYDSDPRSAESPTPKKMDDEDEDGEEEEDADDERPHLARKANPFFHMRLRSSTPESRPRPDQASTPGGTQMSRATSGTGVSVDDALVLSD
jgi:hypothetical protein